jgi:hypothetical protein
MLLGSSAKGFLFQICEIGGLASMHKRASFFLILGQIREVAKMAMIHKRI